MHHPSDPCARCGHALGPMGSHLHYDHDDRDPTRTTYLGFSHGRSPCPECGAKCNELAASRAGAGAPPTRQPTRPTLRW